MTNLTCAFIYIAPGLDPLRQNAVIPSDDVPMYVVGCSNYEQAECVAAALAAKGCQCIDLCPGFGVEGVARVKRAAGPAVKVGVVRYDTVPVFGNQSGDELFK